MSPPASKAQQVVPWAALHHEGPDQLVDWKQAFAKAYCLLELSQEAQEVLSQARAFLQSTFQQAASGHDSIPGYSQLQNAEKLHVQSGANEQLRGSPMEKAICLLDDIARKVLRKVLPEAADTDLLLEAPPSSGVPQRCCDLTGWRYQPMQPQQAGSNTLGTIYDWQLQRGLLTIKYEDLPGLQVMGMPDGSLQLGPGHVAILAGYSLQKAWGVKHACWYRVRPPPAGGPSRFTLVYKLRALPDATLSPGRIRQVSVADVYKEFDLNMVQQQQQEQQLAAYDPLNGNPTYAQLPPSLLSPAESGPLPSIQVPNAAQAPPSLVMSPTHAIASSNASSPGPVTAPLAPIAGPAPGLKAHAESLTFRVYVFGVNGRTVPLEVHPLTTVAQLKARLGAKGGDQEGHGVLVYGGRRMEEARRLLDYGVVDNSTLQLVGLHKLLESVTM